jgi:hypothetical protein
MSNIGLQIKATANVEAAKKGLADLQTSLAKTAVAGAKYDSALDKSRASSDRAGQALQNLGRIAQDAPFGFIGIQNNINPLLESFQRLKVETGSTGGALKALVGGLVGAGGLGLAVSLATASLTVFSQSGLFKTSKAVDENIKKNKELADSYSSIVSSISEETTKVAVLITQLKDEAITRGQRQEAIKRLQQIAPAYFATLDTEKATIGQITQAYDAYTKSILKSVEARVRQKELQDISDKIIKLQDLGAKAGREKIVVDGKLVTVNSSRLETLKDINNTQNAYQRFQQGTLNLTKQEVDELGNLKITQQKLIDLVAKSQGLESLNIVPDKEKIKTAATTAKETVIDVLAKLRAQIKELNIEETLFNDDKSKERTSAFLSAVKTLVTKYKIDPEGKLIQGLFDEAKIAKIGFIQNGNLIKAGLDVANRFKKGFDTQEPALIGVELNIIPTIPPTIKNLLNSADLDALPKLAFLRGVGITKGMQDGINVGVRALRMPELTELYTSIKQATDNLQNSVKSTIANSISTAFESIGKGDNPFKAIFTILASGLVDLGKALIAYGVEVGIIQKIFANPLNPVSPVLAIAAGIAITALGSLLKSKTSKQFATGGFVSGPGTGTSDSINARLSNGEFVLQAAAVNKFGVGFLNSLNNGILPQGAGSNSAVSIPSAEGNIFIPAVTLRGADLVVSFNRSSKTNSRNS